MIKKNNLIKKHHQLLFRKSFICFNVKMKHLWQKDSLLTLEVYDSLLLNQKTSSMTLLISIYSIYHLYFCWNLALISFSWLSKNLDSLSFEPSCCFSHWFFIDLVFSFITCVFREWFDIKHFFCSFIFGSFIVNVYFKVEYCIIFLKIFVCLIFIVIC